MNTADRAEEMGRRAGEALAATGVPTPNPFRARGPGAQRDLAAAWRRGYFAALRAARRG